MRDWVHPRWPWCWPRQHDWNSYTMWATNGGVRCELNIVVCDRCGKVD
jgi:hypothetical protein